MPKNSDGNWHSIAVGAWRHPGDVTQRPEFNAALHSRVQSSFPPPPPAVAINLSFVSGAVIRGPIWILLVASSQLIVVLIHPVSLAGFHLLFDPFNNGHLSESVVALNRSWCNCWGFLWRFKPNKLSTDLYPFPRECGKYCRGIFPLLIGEKERNTCPFCCFGDGADKLVASPSLPSLHHLLFFFYSRLLFCRVFPLVFSFFHFFIRILPWEIAGSRQPPGCCCCCCCCCWLSELND